MSTRAVRNLSILWMVWIFIVLGFQAWTAMRFQVRHPDYALEWTPIDTSPTYKLHKPYLNEPFMNQQVAFDSEYYLSIATVGYDDPAVSRGVINGLQVPLNYAYLPLYPYVMRVVAFPLKLLGLDPIATSTLAGVIVAVLGTLGGLVALYDMAREELEESGAFRAAVYLLIYPAGFFLAMVYTEGLFIGLAFGALALTRRKQWLWAAILAACATLTRAVGVALVIPLVLAFIRTGTWREIRLGGPGLKRLGQALILVMPVLVYIIWRLSPLGRMFQLVDEEYFGRQFLSVGKSVQGWIGAFRSMFGNNPQTTAYYMIEFGAALLSIVACFFTWRRYPEATIFSLAVILISFTSGYPQGMHRYVMTAPVLFLFLARLGKNPIFDRAWSMLSTLLMGALALLFAADMWAG